MTEKERLREAIKELRLKSMCKPYSDEHELGVCLGFELSIDILEKALADTEDTVDTGGERCPTCGSTNKHIYLGEHGCSRGGYEKYDPWHDSPPKEQDDEAIIESILNELFPMGRSDVTRDHSRERLPKEAIKKTLRWMGGK